MFYRAHNHGNACFFRGWVGFDMDGTLLAEGGPGFDREIYGAPVPGMIELVRWYLDQGYEVRIFTARVAPDRDKVVVERNRAAILAWTKRTFGVELQPTCSKDGGCVAIYDDIAHGVLPGGVIETDLIRKLKMENRTLRKMLKKHNPEWESLDVFS